jgi:two-component system response regulator MprA/two-component system response regulator TrcR
MENGTRILVVEDDPSISRLVQLELEHRRFTVRCARDGPSGLAAVSEFRPAAIVLDIMLPGMDGVAVLKRLREAGNAVPVIMLTARGDPMDKVHSLDRGADDYLTKPFDVEELMARLRALLRRAGQEEILRVADLEIDTLGRRVRRGTREVELTAREFDLLEFMARNRRRVLSRDLLLSRVWNQEFGIATNVVDVYVGYLRKKIDGPGERPLIRTVRGVGYVLRED